MYDVDVHPDLSATVTVSRGVSWFLKADSRDHSGCHGKKSWMAQTHRAGTGDSVGRFRRYR